MKPSIAQLLVLRFSGCGEYPLGQRPGESPCDARPVFAFAGRDMERQQKPPTWKPRWGQEGGFGRGPVPSTRWGVYNTGSLPHRVAVALPNNFQNCCVFI